MTIYFGTQCPLLSVFNETCTGLVSVMDLYVEVCTIIASYNDSELFVNITQLPELVDIDTWYMQPWQTEVRDNNIILGICLFSNFITVKHLLCQPCKIRTSKTRYYCDNPLFGHPAFFGNCPCCP
jgi:hypothetical protein